MNRKIITAAFGAFTLLAGVNCLAALSEAEKGYVNQLVTGGPLTIRSVAQNLYNTGNKNTEVLDVAAVVWAMDGAAAEAVVEAVPPLRRLARFTVPLA